MHIVIDIDKTVFETDSLIYKLATKINHNKGLDEPLSYKIVDSKNYKEGSNLLSFTKLDNCNVYKPIENSVEILQKWQKQGIKFSFVSSRPNTKLWRVSAVELFKKYNINYYNLVLACNNKASFCKVFNFDIVIDDNVKHCNDTVRLGKKSIWFSNSPSEKQEKQKVKGVIHATSWNDIDKFVQSIYGNESQKSQELTK